MSKFWFFFSTNDSDEFSKNNWFATSADTLTLWIQTKNLKFLKVFKIHQAKYDIINILSQKKWYLGNGVQSMIDNKKLKFDKLILLKESWSTCTYAFYIWNIQYYEAYVVCLFSASFFYW
jgi:hypothetical protein